MPDRAKVTSLEAIEAFRAKLIIYRDKAGRVLDEVSDSVTRTRLWLQNDRLTHWQHQIRRLTHELEQRQQELFSAQLSGTLEASPVEQAAVAKARRALQEAEARYQTVRQWNRQFDHRVEPLGRNVEKLRHTLGHDLGLAVARLNEISQTLSAYAELSASGAAPAQPVPATTATETKLSEPATGGAPA
jgi:hypothetical protein